jgi:hypothetical protein
VKKLILISCVAICPFRQAAAQASLPAELQGVMLAKILRYDRQFAAKVKDRVLVVYHRADDPACRTVSMALTAGGAATSEATLEGLASVPSDALALYACAGVAVDQVAKAAEKSSLLTLTGTPGLVTSGTFTLGLEVGEDGRPQVVINMSRMKKEGHMISSELLALARVIR